MSLHNTQKKPVSQSDGKLYNGFFPFWKKSGETLVVLLRRFREERGISADEKITYAGRLDPMAEGLVPMLVGEARFQKEHLMAKSKTYEVSIALGLATDSGDMLGLLSHDSMVQTEQLFSSDAIEKALATLAKLTELPYPMYSSRPVDGKPLFVHARSGRKVAVPMKKISIYSMELLEIKQVGLQELLHNTQEIIKKVQGDFRQKEIIEQWDTLATASASQGYKVQVVTIRTTVSSGAYMRSLSEKMGELLGIPALAYKIVRTNIEA
jgi:tRNA pseudouridine(55) synthase